MAHYPNIKGIYVSLKENKLGTCVDIDINISLFLAEIEKYKQTENTLYVLGIPRKELVNNNSTHLCVVTAQSTAKYPNRGGFTQRGPVVLGHDIDDDEEFKNDVLREFNDDEEKPRF